jgi:hypothetical protein
MPRLAHADNLQLIVEGPFVVCENVDGKNLTIAVPVLDQPNTPAHPRTHYAPILSGNFGDVSLGQLDKPGSFRAPSDGLESNLTFNRTGPVNSTFVIAKGPNAEIYNETGDCGTLNPNLASYQLKVPVPNSMTNGIPDGITAYRPLEYKDRAYVVDAKRNPQGPCSAPCPYGTRLVLHYSNVDLGTVHIHTTCNGNPVSCTPVIETGGDYDDWTIDAKNAIDGDLEIELSAAPSPSNLTPPQHAVQAFAAASALSGIPRTWVPYTSKTGSVTKNPILHVECQVGPPIFCRHCTPTP